MSFWCITNNPQSQCCKTIIISYSSFSWPVKARGLGSSAPLGFSLRCRFWLFHLCPSWRDSSYLEVFSWWWQRSMSSWPTTQVFSLLTSGLHHALGGEMWVEWRRKKYVLWAVRRHWKLTWYPVVSYILGSKWRIIQSTLQTSATKVGI